MTTDETSSDSITQLLTRLREGDSDAASDLLQAIYRDLHRVASARMNRERESHTFQASDLVHEAYLRLVRSDDFTNWNSRRHFFAAASEAMRRILIEYARRRQSQKRGGDHLYIDLSHDLIMDDHKADRLLLLEDALTALEQFDARKAQLVKLRFFGGMTIEQVAEALEISTTTADRDWAYARAWLKARMVEEYGAR